MERDRLVSYLDDYLRVADIEDKSQNGLQVEGPAVLQKVAFAVDSSLVAFDRAVAAGAQLLIVHHGLFWGRGLRLVGPHFARIRTLIEGHCGLYAAHLPLDLHPEVGNNVELARLLRLEEVCPFGDYHGIEIGVRGVLEPPLEVALLIGRLTQVLSVPPIRILAHGPERAREVAIVSGAAIDLIDQVDETELDTFITGETDHAFFHQASERHLNVFFAGHYATETLGVKALARHLEQRFELETVFLDVPTGM
jgi:dinuclear metal center YbgI/SA1388 family protein